MKKRKEKLRKKMTALNDELDAMDYNRQLTYERITGVDLNHFRVVDDNCISVNLETFEELQKVIKRLKPFKNGWEINHTECAQLTSLYRVDVKNEVRGRSRLQIQMENATGTKYWFSLDVTCLPSALFTQFFVRSTRKPFNSERHYFEVSNAVFKDTPITCVRFRIGNIGWYGGDQTLVNATLITALIEDILNVKLWERVTK